MSPVGKSTYHSGHAHTRRCVESTNRGLGIPRIVTEFISSSNPNPNADSDWLEKDSAAAVPTSHSSQEQINVFRCVGSAGWRQAWIEVHAE